MKLASGSIDAPGGISSAVAAAVWLP
jgi:hypothetical protein